MKKTFIALCAGIVIGILIAPRKGADTRQKMLDGLDGLVDRRADEINSWKDEVPDGWSEEDNNLVQPIV